MSDDADACKVASKFINGEQRKKLLQIAWSRKKRAVIKSLDCTAIFENFTTFTSPVKSEEFVYSDNILKVIEKWIDNRSSKDKKKWIPLGELLHELKASKLHYEENCPEKCQQKRKCLRVRQAKKGVLAITKEISKQHPVFEDLELIVVGSMKEGTKVGEIDETDMTLIINKKFDRHHFMFHEDKQHVKDEQHNKEFVKIDHDHIFYEQQRAQLQQKEREKNSLETDLDVLNTKIGEMKLEIEQQMAQLQQKLREKKLLKTELDVLNMKIKKMKLEISELQNLQKLQRTLLKNCIAEIEQHKKELNKNHTNPRPLDEFINKEGIFDTSKYFNTFVEEVQKVISSGAVDFPVGLRFSTSYHSCPVCRSYEDIDPQDVRFRVCHGIICKDFMMERLTSLDFNYSGLGIQSPPFFLAHCI